MTPQKVSPHFTLAELTTTDHREFLAQQADPPPDVRRNLVRLCFDLLEPARGLLGPLHVNSGYRCPELNAAIPGSSRTSAHMLGCAADVVPLDVDLRDAMVRLAASGLPFDQLIWEYGHWVHIGAPWGGNLPRGQRLAIWTPGHYEEWSAEDPRFQEG